MNLRIKHHGEHRACTELFIMVLLLCNGDGQKRSHGHHFTDNLAIRCAPAHPRGLRSEGTSLELASTWQALNRAFAREKEADVKLARLQAAVTQFVTQ